MVELFGDQQNSSECMKAEVEKVALCKGDFHLIPETHIQTAGYGDVYYVQDACDPSTVEAETEGPLG